ncbi:MAG: hypothetical protein OXI18_07165 [bacterium]|nr:hypothetical protein [Gammaproteobacteria bacterium]MDE0604168.1 hypothetical protein [bacterium]
MDLSEYLASTQLIDCTGKVTHTLTLLPDGMVEVVTGAVTAIVDPHAKSVVRPAGVRIHDQIFDHASVLAREAFG